MLHKLWQHNFYTEMNYFNRMHLVQDGIAKFIGETISILHLIWISKKFSHWHKSSQSSILSVVDGGRPNIHHINTPLRPMAPPWQTSLHKLPVAVIKKFTTAALWSPFNNTQVDMDNIMKHLQNGTKIPRQNFTLFNKNNKLRTSMCEVQFIRYICHK